MKISLVYDNRLKAPGFESGWGFSCLIEISGRRILFDTGDNGQKFLGNLKALEVSPSSIDTVILSHDHWDHTGGLEDFLKSNGKADIFIASSFNSGFEKSVSFCPAPVKRVSKSLKIAEGVTTTDELKGLTGPDEIGIILSSEKGPVLICGCAHPGVVNMVRHVAEISGEAVYAVFGGAHFYKSQDNEIKKAMDDLRAEGVKKSGLCHCTGDAAMEMFRKEWGEDFIDFASRRVMEL
ncbi:MAG: MBL fold metallo-hydrolase [Elusimicrobiota bacterium]|nr:MBL fold metallo-hydrolase [Elusimicrobiota bacterium]